MAAPAIASVGTQASSSGTTCVVNVPSGVSSGALVVAYVTVGYVTATVPTSSCVTPPSGWSLGYGASVQDSPDGAYAWQGWYYKFASGADSGSYTFTLGTVGGQTQIATGGIALRVTAGPTSGNPFVDTLHSVEADFAGGGAVNVTQATFTPSTSNSLLVAGCGSFSPFNGSPVVPSGWTSNAMTSGNGGVASVAQTTATATGTLTFAFSNDVSWLGIGTINASNGGGSGVTGTLSGAVPKLKFSGTATSTVPAVTGTLSGAVPKLKFSGTASTTVPVFTGSLTANVPIVQFSASATSTVPSGTAELNAQLPIAGFDGTAMVAAPVFSATLSAVLPVATFAASGTVTPPSAVTATLGANVPLVRFSAHAGGADRDITVTGQPITGTTYVGSQPTNNIASGGQTSQLWTGAQITGNTMTGADAQN